MGLINFSRNGNNMVVIKEATSHRNRMEWQQKNCAGTLPHHRYFYYSTALWERGKGDQKPKKTRAPSSCVIVDIYVLSVENFHTLTFQLDTFCLSSTLM